MSKRNIIIIAIVAALVIIGIVIAVVLNNNDTDDIVQDQVQTDEVAQEEDQVQDEVEDDATAGQALYSFTMHQVTDGLTTFYVVENPGGGATLSFAADSGIDLIVIQDGDYEFAFRNMSGSDDLEIWEDWRLPAEVRAADLVSQLTVEQLSGLMLFSGHTNSADLMTAAHQEWIGDNHLRLILNAGDSYVEPNVQWNNQMQAFAESVRTAQQPLIPINIASDPRSTAGAAIYDADGEISGWPGNLGLAATFNTQYMLNFAQMASAEYRALGIVTALSPQVDLATDPRWIRNEGTLGEDVTWARQLAAVYVDGFQNSYGQDIWGSESVATMIKHFGGDGANEGGRIAHMSPGSFDVFPGGGQLDHFNVFADAMHSAGVMTGYPIALDRDGNVLWSTQTRDREGNIIAVDGGISTGFNVDVMNFLRQDLGFEGAIVTDWAVTNNPGGFLATGWGTHGDEFIADWAWGMPAAEITEEILEEQRLAMAQRIFVLLVNGMDMFGGLNVMQPVIGGDWTQNRPPDQGGPITVYGVDGAFQMWQRAYELGNLPIDARTRWEESGVRILSSFFFETGLYENPFLDLAASLAIVGAPEKQAAGFAAQLASVIMLSNDGSVASSNAADWANMTVYVPASLDIGWAAFGPANETSGATLDIGILEHFFGTVLTDEIILDADGNVEEFIPPSAEQLAGVDIVLVGMDTPNNGSQFSSSGFSDGQWLPLSLQWGVYTADGPYVRQVSISGMPQADGTRENRSYFGNTARISNAEHLVSFERAAAIAADLGVPVITLVRGVGSSTFVPVEIYEASSAILLGFGISDQALIEVGLGLREPSGRLPMTMPADMNAVERQLEDIADTDPFVDSAGNAWGFGFGLNFSGPIN